MTEGCCDIAASDPEFDIENSCDPAVPPIVLKDALNSGE